MFDLQKSSELTKRVITAVFGVAVLILLVLFGGWLGICLLTTVLSLAMVYEYAKMTLKLPDEGEKTYALLCATFFVGLANLLAPGTETELAITVFLSLSIYFLLTAGRYEGAEFSRHFQELTGSFFGIIYIVFLLLFMTRIQATASGRDWILVFFFIVWAADSGAYFAGKKFGRHKLYPQISPKKSREGAIGGLLLAIAVTILYKLLFFPSLSWSGAFIVPVVVGIASQLGDLLESFLKRAYGIKDSGAILPGHGGFLDRFDGVVFSAPVMYACVRLFA